MDLGDVPAWAVWLGAAILLGVAELFTLDLILLMLAGGALAGMVVDLLAGPLVLQVLVAVVTAAGMLALVRPNIVRRLHGGPELRMGHKALIGRQALVVEEVSVHGGQVRIDGELWTARPFDESEVIEPGATVDVFEIRGATAYVHRVPSLDA